MALIATVLLAERRVHLATPKNFKLQAFPQSPIMCWLDSES